MNAPLAFLPDEAPEGGNGWFLEQTDTGAASEFDRQRAFLSELRRSAPGVMAFAVPNGSRDSDWTKLRKWKEGAVAGMTDLVILWAGGVFFAEMKAGKGRVDPKQSDVLNRLHRMGYPCGVYRRPETLIAHLRKAGAPFLFQVREGRL